MVTANTRWYTQLAYAYIVLLTIVTDWQRHDPHNGGIVWASKSNKELLTKTKTTHYIKKGRTIPC